MHYKAMKNISSEKDLTTSNQLKLTQTQQPEDTTTTKTNINTNTDTRTLEGFKKSFSSTHSLTSAGATTTSRHNHENTATTTHTDSPPSIGASTRKRLRETAKPLVLTAAYEVVSKVVDSNALAFGLVSGAYVLANNVLDSSSSTSNNFNPNNTSPSEGSNLISVKEENLNLNESVQESCMPNSRAFDEDNLTNCASVVKKENDTHSPSAAINSTPMIVESHSSEQEPDEEGETLTETKTLLHPNENGSQYFPSSNNTIQPPPRKRRRRKRDTIYHMIDLLNPMSSFLPAGHKLRSHYAKNKSKLIRSFPNRMSNKLLWKLSTAPVEENLKGDLVVEEETMDETKISPSNSCVSLVRDRSNNSSSSSPQGSPSKASWQHKYNNILTCQDPNFYAFHLDSSMTHECHEHGRVEVCSFFPDEEDDDDEHHDMEQHETNIDTNNKSHDNHTVTHHDYMSHGHDHTHAPAVSDDNEEEPSNSMHHLSPDANFQSRPISKADSTTTIVTRKRSSSMNVNPSAAFGVAGELCRQQMDAKEMFHKKNKNSIVPLTSSPQSTKNSRRRFLHSLYSHAGIPPSNDQTNPLSTPLILATNYNVRSSGAWSDDDYFYSRISNPTRDALEDILARAEQGVELDETDDERYACKAACFGSGMAAVSAVVGAASSIMGSGVHTHNTSSTTTQSSSSSTSSNQRGVHIILPKTCYDESVKMIQMGWEGITSFIRVDMLDTKSVDAAMAKHPDMGKVLFLETPDNPLVNVCNLTTLVSIARKHDAMVLVDTTWSPPLVCQSFRYGIDALCFSCTKTMGGHSDALAGAVVTNGATPLGRALYPRVKDIQITLGGVASPFDSWLVLRGLRTMPVRMERMCDTSMKLARFLENHPLAEWVRYPGLSSHPQHELAKSQMDLFGQMVTWCIRGGSEAAMAFVGAVKLARRATSTGGTETLVQHQRSVEMEKVTPGGIIRMSIGLEHADDLIEDFDKALSCVALVCRRGGSIAKGLPKLIGKENDTADVVQDIHEKSKREKDIYALSTC